MLVSSLISSSTLVGVDADDAQADVDVYAEAYVDINFGVDVHVAVINSNDVDVNIDVGVGGRYRYPLLYVDSAPSTTPLYHLPPFLAAVGRSTVSSPNSKGDFSLDAWWLGTP